VTRGKKEKKLATVLITSAQAIFKVEAQGKDVEDQLRLQGSNTGIWGLKVEKEMTANLSRNRKELRKRIL